MAGIGGQEFKNRPLGVTIASGGGVSCRFVQQDASGGNGPYGATTDPDIIITGNTGRKIPAVRAVHRHAPLEDQLLAGAS